MKREEISKAVGNIADRHVEAVETAGRTRFVSGTLFKGLVAAMLAVCLLAGGALILGRPGAMTVTAYAYGTEEILTSAGMAFTTGTVTDEGRLTGHPLMFCLGGDAMESVRFSCENGYLRFRDLTEKRDEYGLARNFTVEYGEDTSEYGFLILDWQPSEMLRALRESKKTTLENLAEELRCDKIVMEVTFVNGKKAVKAIKTRLSEDGTFFLSFDDYRVTDADEFVSRHDAKPVSREELYGQGEAEVTFIDKDGDVAVSDAGWYNTVVLDSIVVSWSGGTPESVKVFATPTGTETMDEMELLATKIPGFADTEVVISADIFEKYGELYTFHLEIEIDYGASRIRSEDYNLFADSDQADRYWLEKGVLEKGREYLEAKNIAYTSICIWKFTENSYTLAVWTVSDVKEEPDMALAVELRDGGWRVSETPET